MWDAVDAAKREHCGDIIARPPNSFTAGEFASRYGYSQSHARSVLAAMAQKKLITKGRAYIPDSAGTLQVMNCYTPTGGAK